MTPYALGWPPPDGRDDRPSALLILALLIIAAALSLLVDWPGAGTFHSFQFP